MVGVELLQYTFFTASTQAAFLSRVYFNGGANVSFYKVNGQLYLVRAPSAIITPRLVVGTSLGDLKACRQVGRGVDWQRLYKAACQERSIVCLENLSP